MILNLISDNFGKLRLSCTKRNAHVTTKPIQIHPFFPFLRVVAHPRDVVPIGFRFFPRICDHDALIDDNLLITLSASPTPAIRDGGGGACHGIRSHLFQADTALISSALAIRLAPKPAGAVWIRTEARFRQQASEERP